MQTKSPDPVCTNKSSPYLFFQRLDPHPHVLHARIRRGNDLGAAFQLRRDLWTVSACFFIFHIMFEARPKIHGDGTKLDLDAHDLFAVRKKDGHFHDHVIAAVTVQLWFFYVIFDGNDRDVILPRKHFRHTVYIIDLFTNIKMHEHGNEKDILGRTYEYCLSKFAEQEGKLAGEFYTPSCVVRTLVEILQPYQGRVYDPCCGSGGMFVQSAKFIENHSGNINDISVYGQDSNPTTWKMAQMNLAIRGIDADLGQYNADTFFNDCHPTLRADYIMANPPFNLSDWGADKLQDDVRWKYGIPPAGNANFAWLQHMIYHLAPNGRIGMVLANGSLSSQSGGEGEIRKNIINADLVDCIIAMPAQLFYTTQIPVSLWFLSKNKKQKGKTLFIDARKMGTMVTRKLRELTDEDIKKLAETYNAYVEGTLENVKGFCAVVETAEIAKQDYILTPGRYVGIEEQQDDGEPFEEKMTRLTTELSEMFKKSHNLEEEIRKNLGAIGYEL